METPRQKPARSLFITIRRLHLHWSRWRVTDQVRSAAHTITPRLVAGRRRKETKRTRNRFHPRKRRPSVLLSPDIVCRYAGNASSRELAFVLHAAPGMFYERHGRGAHKIKRAPLIYLRASLFGRGALCEGTGWNQIIRKSRALSI